MIPFGRYARLATPAVVRELGPGPYLLKPRDMGMGFGVLKVDTVEQLNAAIDLCAGADQAFLVQRFLPNSGDMRTYVINGQVVTAQLRKPAPGNYLANISQGGKGSVGEYAQVEGYCAKIVASTGASYLAWCHASR